ncbi:molybdenum cofactor cytidylyltransferase [Prosthecobacter fusiformis]|uniref:Molybdenum cofactor cytidylyltransferase n=1 Tax=Prosthecobacter fusiformis TaxID=48464 RepID=A0A4R7RXH8_9BACT|nr:nucleotidyltransferase family protein [Prosthecobacter fusiformis]TDU70572.1 molybdenum cofactor cytidylyltransferase [Prosthecobacter fusiformis]
MHLCGAVILAAGASSRMGVAKQLLPFEGQPLIVHIARIALVSEVSSVAIVLGAHAEVCAMAVADLPVRVVNNPHWQEGMASSIRAGVDALGSEVDSLVILLCDQPQISPALINALISTGHPLAACRYGQTVGPPVFISRPFFEELRGLQGDTGAKSLLKAHAEKVGWVDFPAGANDLDTPADYARV